jgi:hypothetical protein
MSGYSTGYEIQHACGHRAPHKVFGGQKQIEHRLGSLEQQLCPACYGASLVPVIGNTFPVRAQLKALGARWDPRERVWRVPPQHADEARAVVATARGDA